MFAGCGTIDSVLTELQCLQLKRLDPYPWFIFLNPKNLYQKAFQIFTKNLKTPLKFLITIFFSPSNSLLMNSIEIAISQSKRNCKKKILETFFRVSTTKPKIKLMKITFRRMFWFVLFLFLYSFRSLSLPFAKI